MLKHEKEQAVSQAQSVDVVAIQPRWLRPTEAAKYAGLSRSTLYTEISSGNIRSYRVKGCRLIDRLELDRFISAQAE